MSPNLSIFKTSWRHGVLLAAILVILLTWPAAIGAQTNPNISSSAAVGMPIPLAGIRIPGLIGRIIQYLLGLSGVIALVMFIYGGLSWMLAQGNQEKITKAKNTVVWAIIGLILIFSSYTIAKFVLTALGQK